MPFEILNLKMSNKTKEINKKKNNKDRDECFFNFLCVLIFITCVIMVHLYMYVLFLIFIPP